MQNEDGGWGTRILGPSTMFGTCLNYVTLRLLGNSPEHDSLSKGRTWILSHGSATAIPQWGKIWLSVWLINKVWNSGLIVTRIWYLKLLICHTYPSYISLHHLCVCSPVFVWTSIKRLAKESAYTRTESFVSIVLINGI